MRSIKFKQDGKQIFQQEDKQFFHPNCQKPRLETKTSSNTILSLMHQPVESEVRNEGKGRRLGSYILQQEDFTLSNLYIHQ